MTGGRLVGLCLAIAVVLALGLGTAVTAPDTSSPWSLLGGGGGGTASSTNFQGGFSAGQTAIGQAQGSAFALSAGYWYGARDQDNDRLAHAADPCPAVPDCDADGWNDGIEKLFIGTDPLDNCANTPDQNDEADDRWPADLNDDRISDISDLSPMAGQFNKAVPSAPARYDIAPDPPNGVVDISDISRLAGLFGDTCT